MSEYLLVLPIEPMPLDASYLPGVSLPLHCTVMHWFRPGAGLDPDELSGRVGACAAAVGQEYIELVSREAALFGSDENVPCHILERNDQLNLLHTRLFRILVETRCVFTQLRWVGAGYRPHVATCGECAFLPGVRFEAKSMALIERVQDKAVKDIFEFR